jgi:pyocin large subunit-like protein
MPPVQLLPGAIAAMLADTAETKTLTEADRYGLLAAIFTENIEDDERRAVDRILRSVCRGRLALG